MMEEPVTERNECLYLVVRLTFLRLSLGGDITPLGGIMGIELEHGMVHDTVQARRGYARATGGGGA